MVLVVTVRFFPSASSSFNLQKRNRVYQVHVFDEQSAIKME